MSYDERAIGSPGDSEIDTPQNPESSNIENGQPVSATHIYPLAPNCGLHPITWKQAPAEPHGYYDRLNYSKGWNDAVVVSDRHYADLSAKANYWFSILRKCAELLKLNEDKEIPTGVLEAVSDICFKVAKLKDELRMVTDERNRLVSDQGWRDNPDRMGS